jgi:site-specific recombinase XerD
LDHLERERHNSVRTRNNRMAAIRSLFQFASFREPADAAVIQRVLAIPEKRGRRAIVSYLSTGEVDALLAAPDRDTWIGRRDHALLVTTLQTGLRVSELTPATAGRRPRHRRSRPLSRQGRKDRCVPLTRHTVEVLRTWLAERGGTDNDALFPTRRGGALSPDSVGDLIDRYVAVAKERCPDWSAGRVTPHTLRHTCAMQLLASGVETSVIALWLGHEHIQTTQIYLHGDLTMKQRALDRTTPPNTPTGRYKAPDPLLAFLDSL